MMYLHNLIQIKKQNELAEKQICEGKYIQHTFLTGEKMTGVCFCVSNMDI